MDYPSWLGNLSKRDESLRAHHGLYPARDGWYKTVRLKKRYIAKPMPLADVVRMLPARIDEITGAENGVSEKSSRLATNATTIEGLSEMFLAHLWQRHQTGSPRQLARRTYDDYVDVLDRFVELVGPNQPAVAVNPTWFTKFMRTIGSAAVSTQRREIIYITAFFNWAGPGRHALNFYKIHVQFGPDFRKPDESRLRSEMADYSTLFTPEQIAAALDLVAPSPLLYAMGLLCLNCALLPEDVDAIPLSAVDLGTGLFEFPRVKTGVARKAMLMPETIDALQRYLADRPTQKTDGTPADPMLFLRDDGRAFSVREDVGPSRRAGHGHALAQYWNSITGKPIKGLRTTFASEADDHVDQAAVDLVMGHAPKSVRQKHYVKKFKPERLRAVAEFVWQRVAPPERRPDVASISPFGLARRVGARAVMLSKPRVRKARSAAVAA